MSRPQRSRRRRVSFMPVLLDNQYRYCVDEPDPRVRASLRPRIDDTFYSCESIGGRQHAMNQGKNAQPSWEAGVICRFPPVMARRLSSSAQHSQ